MKRHTRILLLGLLLCTFAAGGIVVGALVERYSLDRVLRQFGLATYQFVPSRSGSITLKTRRFVPSVEKDSVDSELDSVYEEMLHPLDLERTALVLIDPWEYHPNDGYLERVKTHMREKLLPLIEIARSAGMRIIYSPHKIPLIPGNREVAQECYPVEGEYVFNAGLLSNPTIEFDEYLKTQGITTLVYAGYAVNACIIIRPTGIIRMKDLGYEVILVRDCTIAWETPESLEGEWANKIGVNLVEWFWGESTTLEDIRASLSGMSGRS
jgi:nicotinamidase-related amidase